jgi:hypothetical protein
MENQDHDFWMKVSDKVPTDFSSVFDARGLGCLNKYRLADCWLTRRFFAVLAGYEGSCDFPSAVYYKQQMRAYPNAKVILTVRDPEKW